MGVETDVIRAVVGVAIERIGDALPIHAPMRTFDPKRDAVDGKYVELLVLDLDPARTTWGDEKLQNGALRIILHWPTNNEGMYEPDELVREFASAFVKDEVYFKNDARVTITDNPGPVLTDTVGHDNTFAVSVPYQCFHVR